MPSYSDNKKAHFDYEILETMEAGLVLSGGEVKSIRTGQANLKGAFITFHDHKAWLTGAHIPKYKFSSVLTDDPDRSRQILLKLKEMTYLREKMQERGLTIVPLSLYNSGRLIKLKVAVAKGKKRFDKRESIKDRENKREIGRILKNN